MAGVSGWRRMLFEVPAWEVGAPAVARKPQKEKRKRPAEEAQRSSRGDKDAHSSRGGQDDCGSHGGQDDCDSHDSRDLRMQPASSKTPTPKDRMVVNSVKPRTTKTISATHPKTASNVESKLNGTQPKTASKIESKLSGARFRYLNQKLYESSSAEALSYFQQHPDDFLHYHSGFREQTKAWPVNPVDVFIGRLGRKLDNSKTILTVADMGCGEAKLAQVLSQRERAKVHSFDLAAVNDFVTVASMTKVPLGDSTVDIVIFSLSLMNTDYTRALAEAYRILKPRGELWIAEVSSRLDGVKGTEHFCQSLQMEGFSVGERDTSNPVFIVLYATKEKRRGDKRATPVLKPCLYKKR